MNPLHTHDIIDNLTKAIPHPLEIDSHCFGSDPITHKKVREEEQINEPLANSSSVQSTSTATSSSTVDTQTKTTDTSDQYSNSSVKREKEK